MAFIFASELLTLLLFAVLCIAVAMVPFVMLMTVLTYRSRKRMEDKIYKMNEAARHLISHQ